MNESPRSTPDDAVDRSIGTRMCRRTFLGTSMLGLGGIAMNSLLSRDLFAGAGAVAVPNHRATARNVIVLFMSGGLSQLDLFDHKPILDEHAGEELPESVRKGQRITGVTERQGTLPVAGTSFEFARHGKCGMEISDALPHLAKIVDDITLIRSMRNDSVLHEAALTAFFTGTTLVNRPSLGAWATYALGAETSDLPEFVVFTSGRTRVQPLHSRLWGAGFLPSRHQGVQFRTGGDPVLYVQDPEGLCKEGRRSILDAIRDLNEMEQDATGDPEIHTRIAAYETAARMQTSIPELMDFSSEPKEVLEMYGAKPGKPSYANNCLVARRLVERGVRFVQLCDRDWDHHFNIPRSLSAKCKDVDQASAALVTDLKQRGLLDDTLVIFAGEFGRTSYCEGPLTAKTYGRDHNSRVGSLWLAGGGVRGGQVFGATDDWGWDTVADPVHVNDLQATILHCLGLDHERLTYRYEGRDFRLTDVAGRVVREILV